MSVAIAVSEQGDRAEMEDFHFLDPDFGGTGSIFGGVYDGHRGNRAARHAAEHLHSYFLDCLQAGLPPPEAFTLAYLKVSDDLKDQDSGTTAATFFVDETLVHTANAGDSRILVAGASGSLQLSVDHRLDDSQERKRIILCGGKIDYPYVMKGFRGVMPTRALGDEYFRDAGVIAAPSVGTHGLRKRDEWLVAATDGLFDVIDNHVTSRLCAEHTDPAELADTLLREVFTRCSRPDNTTIIVVKLR